MLCSGHNDIIKRNIYICGGCEKVLKPLEMNGIEIKEKIEELGLKNKHVAKKVGINPCTLSSIMSNNIKYVSPDVLSRLKEYLNSCRT